MTLYEDWPEVKISGETGAAIADAILATDETAHKHFAGRKVVRVCCRVGERGDWHFVEFEGENNNILMPPWTPEGRAVAIIIFDAGMAREMARLAREEPERFARLGEIMATRPPL